MREIKLQVLAQAGDISSLLFLDWEQSNPREARISLGGVAVTVRVSALQAAVNTLADARRHARDAQSEEEADGSAR
jgi:type II secretory pathway component PulM